MQGAPDVFGNIPTRQCTPPALIKYTLVGIDSAGANISIDRKIINAVGEQIAWRIDPNLASLRIVINVRQEKWTCPDNMLGKYQVSCYSDAGYKKRKRKLIIAANETTRR